MALGYFWATTCLGLLLAIFALDIMGVFSRKNHFEVDGRTVLITGGSQGMGRGLAKLLAEKGANVVIVARNQQKLDDALKYIKAAARNPQSQRFLAISADATKPEENERIISEITAWNNGNPPDVVWANAGTAHPDLFLNTPPDLLKSQMNINYFAAAFLAQSTLRAWLKPSSSKTDISDAKIAKPRHLIMTSSVVCFAGLAGYAPYSPPKSAMRSLADTLRSEVNLYNGARRKDPVNGPPAAIEIHCVCPGTITSPGHEEEQKTKHEVTKMLEEDDPAQNEDEVARAAVRGLEKGGYLITTQFIGHALRAGAMGGSPRNNWLVDTVFSWIVSLAWLFIGPDMEGKVFKYGKKHGLPATK
ncbi:3-ketodihydrosphingosine reductase tsc10 [Lecanosticta acicola]|uniref:3-dehydrosphinganine reductase n=1 Tax=Lecanosticta acicola TaxID=111012 RepID=A0AAI9EDE5_9PEZI|nr:3-ketodihydrosphingosine reductase tsc10 [Lecanosticta acicola]